LELVYDLTERVILAYEPALPLPSGADAHRVQIERAARARVASPSTPARVLPQHLGRLTPPSAHWERRARSFRVEVPGWRHASLHRDAPRPCGIEAHTLFAPFDPLIWERVRTKRLSQFRSRIEIYTPAERRQHNHYMLPFLPDA